MKIDVYYRRGTVAEPRRPATDPEEDLAGYRGKIQEEKDRRARFDQALSRRNDVLEKQKPAIPAAGAQPKDNSARLAHRLVSAGGQFEVRMVVADAMSDLSSLRLAAPDERNAEAVKAAIRKLEKLISRARTKIRELDQEDVLRLEKSRAEHRRQKERTEEIKEELREKMAKRKAREKRYLAEHPDDLLSGARDRAAEAAITAGANTITVMESAFGGMSGDSGGAETAATSGGAPVSSGGGAAAVSSGEAAGDG